ncbi:hypothetical protein DCAR_0934234 [Daucus carota subsp. sativus]|uniref:Uncharacterized protein n=1 Tax=Daucus carota subsp. sativus TaxID=79200 RepID=A0A175YEL3_DAUCS|nr:hypothetical protein DCAR_0934234 [Daucus carota subsp. sativus]
MAEIPHGNSVRRSTRLILKSLQRPISDPVYIDLEADDADQVRKAETMKNVGDIISEEGKNGLVRGEVTLYNSDDDFVNPAPWSKSKEKRKDDTNELRNVKRKIVLEVNHPAETQKGKKKGGQRLVDEGGDEENPEAPRLNDNKTKIKAKKSNVDNKAQKRKAKDKIEERTEIAEKV